MEIKVSAVRTRGDLRDFIDLPYRLYRGAPHFAPPLRTQVRQMLTGKDNMLFACGPHVLLLCRKQGRAVGRVMAGVNLAYNQMNGYMSAWFSLFECEPDESSAAALMQACEDWARQQGVDFLRGPDSPENADSYRGMLVDGFDGPPAMMNNYNPPWYGAFFEKRGYDKMLDLFAYTFRVGQVMQAGKARIINYAMRKYDYRVDHLDLSNLDRDLHDILEILLQAIPTFQEEHMALPTFDDVDKMARSMLAIADPKLVCIARTNRDNRPVGFVVALPDYNQVFRHIRDGRLFPLGMIRLLYYRKRIDAIRVLMQFVIPDFQRKAVNNAIFYQMSAYAHQKGYRTGDGSTIGETNRQSRSSVERLGGEHYRTYRLYKKKLI